MSGSNSLQDVLQSTVDGLHDTHPADQHVDRLLYRVGKDPEQATWGYYASRHAGRPSKDVIEESCLADGRRLALIGNAGSGKSATLIHTFRRVVEAFLNAADQPVPFLLDLDRDTEGSTDFTDCSEYRRGNPPPGQSR